MSPKGPASSGPFKSVKALKVEVRTAVVVVPGTVAAGGAEGSPQVASPQVASLRSWGWGEMRAGEWSRGCAGKPLPLSWETLSPFLPADELLWVLTKTVTSENVLRLYKQATVDSLAQS